MSDTQNFGRFAYEPVPVAKAIATWKLLAAAAVVALFAGGVGAVIATTLVSTDAGDRGPAGPAGPAGESAPARVVDPNKLGYCVDVTNNYGGNTAFVQYMSLYAPTSNNGTLSCSSGQFVSLTPTGPNGNAIKNYDATRPAPTPAP